MTTLERKNHIIHGLLLDLYFCGEEIPQKLEKCIENIQHATGEKRNLLIQQAIGYTVALKDFSLLDFRVCNGIINRLHEAEYKKGNKNMTIKTVHKLSFDNLRNLCIKKEWYTKGTNEEYFNMLQMTDKDDITAEDIYNIAVDIINHSNLDQLAKDYGMGLHSPDFIECIMYEIGCRINIFYDIEK